MGVVLNTMTGWTDNKVEVDTQYWLDMIQRKKWHGAIGETEIFLTNVQKLLVLPPYGKQGKMKGIMILESFIKCFLFTCLLNKLFLFVFDGF